MNSKVSSLLHSPLFWGALLIVCAAILYWVTLAPDLLWGGGDFATYQTRAYLNEIVENEGNAGIFNHPLWIILVHPFTKIPINTPAWRANAAAALFALAALVCVYAGCWRLTRSIPSSLLASAALALSHTFWTYAVMPKVYSLNAFLLAVCCLLLIVWSQNNSKKNWPLYLSTFLYGLSFLNHLVMATALPAFLVFIGLVLRKNKNGRSARTALFSFIVFVVGLLPYLWLTVQTSAGTQAGSSIFSFIQGGFYVLLHPLDLLRGLGWGAGLALYQFPILILFGGWGLYRLWHIDRNMFVLIMLGIAGAFAFLLAATDPRAGGVYIWNLHYYLQAYVFFAFAIGIGIADFWKTTWGQKRWVRAALAFTAIGIPVLAYAISPTAARLALPNVPDFRPLPGRDNFVYVLAPWKHNETGARPFGEERLNALPPDSILFADYSIWAVIRYLQEVEGQRPDVNLVYLAGLSTQVETILPYSHRPNLFLADTYQYYDLEGISEYFFIGPDGPVHMLIWREKAP
jgi:hypothetical protein